MWNSRLVEKYIYSMRYWRNGNEYVIKRKFAELRVEHNGYIEEKNGVVQGFYSTHWKNGKGILVLHLFDDSVRETRIELPVPVRKEVE